LNHVLLGPLNALADGIRHSSRLSHTNTYAALVVSDNYDRSECKAPAAFDHLGRSGNVYNSLIEFGAFVFLPPLSPAISTAISTTHRSSLLPRSLVQSSSVVGSCLSWLKLKPPFSGCVGQGLDPAVIEVSTPIEYDGLDTSFQRSLGKQFTNKLSLR
jgi:hypothetical protein